MLAETHLSVGNFLEPMPSRMPRLHMPRSACTPRRTCNSVQELWHLRLAIEYSATIHYSPQLCMTQQARLAEVERTAESAAHQPSGRINPLAALSRVHVDVRQVGRLSRQPLLIVPQPVAREVLRSSTASSATSPQQPSVLRATSATSRNHGTSQRQR